MASVRRLNRARPLILICTCVLVSQLGVFRLGGWGCEGLRESKRGIGRANEGKTGREWEGGRGLDETLTCHSCQSERERERGRETGRSDTIRCWSGSPLTHPTHTDTRTPRSQTHLFGNLFFLFSPLSAPSLPTYVCTHS